MQLQDILDEQMCERLLLKAQEATQGIFSFWSQGGEGSGASVLTRSKKIYRAGHMSFPSEGGAHAELLALMIAYQSNPEDPVIAAGVISTKPESNIQYPCGSCLQKYADYLDLMSQRKIVVPQQDIIFICGRPDLSYELHSLQNLLPTRWRTNIPIRDTK